MVAMVEVPKSCVMYVGKFQPATAPNSLVVFDPQSIAEPGSNYAFLSLVGGADVIHESEPTWEDAAWQ